MARGRRGFTVGGDTDRTFGGPRTTPPTPKPTRIEDRGGDSQFRPDAPANMDAATVAALFAAAGLPPLESEVKPVTATVQGDGGGDGGGGGTGDFETGERRTTTPFGNLVAPGLYDEAYASPEALIRLFFQNQGMGVRGGLYANALDQANNLGLLWLLLQNQQGPRENANFVDWTGQYLGQQLTPGGAAPGYDQLLAAMFNTDPNNPIRNYLSNPGLDPSDQVANFGSTFNTAMENVLPDIVRAAMLARIRELGDQYEAIRLQGTGGGRFSGSTPFSGYLQAEGFGV